MIELANLAPSAVIGAASPLSLAPAAYAPVEAQEAPPRPSPLADARQWDRPRPIYHPRGAPADAAPALNQLEARLAREPLYMHHIASTRYAGVSLLPWTLAERRQGVDLLV